MEISVYPSILNPIKEHRQKKIERIKQKAKYTGDIPAYAGDAILIRTVFPLLFRRKFYTVKQIEQVSRKMAEILDIAYHARGLNVILRIDSPRFLFELVQARHTTEYIDKILQHAQDSDIVLVSGNWSKQDYEYQVISEQFIKQKQNYAVVGKAPDYRILDHYLPDFAFDEEVKNSAKIDGIIDVQEVTEEELRLDEEFRERW